MAQPYSVVLLASAAQATDGSGSAVDLTVDADDATNVIARRTIQVTVEVTTFTEVSSSPTPSILFTIETRPSDTAPWRPVGTVSAGATGVFELAAGGMDRDARISWTYTNMTTATFAANAVAHVTYCDPADITTYAVPTRSVEDISATTLANACIAATDMADGYLNSSYSLPITAWGRDLRAQCSKLAAADAFRHRGADPAGPDILVFDAEKMAIKWLDRISNGNLKPYGITDQTPTTFEGGGVVVSQPRRGW